LHDHEAAESAASDSALHIDEAETQPVIHFFSTIAVRRAPESTFSRVNEEPATVNELFTGSLKS
jgi:hypothetical protein